MGARKNKKAAGEGGGAQTEGGDNSSGAKLSILEPGIAMEVQVILVFVCAILVVASVGKGKNDVDRQK